MADALVRCGAGVEGGRRGEEGRKIVVCVCVLCVCCVCIR